jgi:hypothetical protein
MRPLVIATLAGLRKYGKGANKTPPDRAANGLPHGSMHPVRSLPRGSL